MGRLLETLTKADDRIRHKSFEKAIRHPFSIPTGSAFELISRFDQQRNAAEEQASHYRGRVFTASQPAINRILRQPIIVAVKRTQKSRSWDKSRSLSNLIKSGELDKDTIPPWVKSRAAAENLEILEDHRILDVLNNPNDLMVTTHLWQMTLAGLDATGEAYWVFDEDPDMVLPIPSTWVTPVPSEDGTRYLGFKIAPPNTPHDVPLTPPENVARFFDIDPFNPRGVYSTIQAMARTILADEAIEKSQDSSFRNSIKPAFAITAGDETGRLVKLQPHQRAQILSWIRSEFSGAVRNGLPIILDAYLRDAKPLFRAPNEMDYMDSAKQTKSSIFEGFQTSPIVAGMVEGANRAGSAVAEFHFTANRTNPRIAMLSQVMTEKVAPFFNETGEKMVMWIEEVKPHDPEHERNLWRDALGNSTVTIDEHRRHLLNLPPLPDGKGNARMVRKGWEYIPIEEEQAMPEDTPAPPPVDQQDKPDPEEDDGEDSSEDTEN